LEGISKFDWREDKKQGEKGIIDETDSLGRVEKAAWCV